MFNISTDIGWVMRILLICVSFITLCYMFSKIRNSKMDIEDSIFWILFAFVIAVLSIFPDIALWAAGVLKIQSPINFVYLVIIFILLVNQFRMTRQMSQMNNRIKQLVQKDAIESYSRESK